VSLEQDKLRAKGSIFPGDLGRLFFYCGRQGRVTWTSWGEGGPSWFFCGLPSEIGPWRDGRVGAVRSCECQLWGISASGRTRPVWDSQVAGV